MPFPRRSAIVLLVGLFMGLAPAWSWAGEDKPTAKATPQASGNCRRLPAYYKDVVSEEQREAIYEIQEEFGAKIAELKVKLAELQKQQAAKVEAVLSPEQKQKVGQLKAAAAAKRHPKAPSAKP